MHDLGIFKVKDNKFTLASGAVLEGGISLIMDMETGTVVKYGNADGDGILSYYNEAKKVLPMLSLVTFTDDLDTVMDLDSKCTIANYLRNSLPIEEVKFLLNSSMDLLSVKVKKLQEVGW